MKFTLYVNAVSNVVFVVCGVNSHPFGVGDRLWTVEEKLPLVSASVQLDAVSNKWLNSGNLCPKSVGYEVLLIWERP